MNNLCKIAQKNKKNLKGIGFSDAIFQLWDPSTRVKFIMDTAATDAARNWLFCLSESAAHL